MKKSTSFFLIFILFFISFSLQAQIKGNADYLVKYEVNFAIDSTDREERTTEMHHLYTGNAVSYYVSEVQLKMDSLFSKFQGMSPEQMRSRSGDFEDLPRPEFLARVYKNFEAQKAMVKVRILREGYIYEEEKFPVEWEITEESKEIGEYTAQKALTSFGGRNYEAWFTLEVPIQDGPYVFSGLPGLILELSDADNDFKFSVSSFKALQEKVEIDIEEKDFKTVEKKKFVKAFQNFRENPLGPFTETVRNMDQIPDPTTGDMISGPELIRKVKKEAKKRNNYIERF